MERKLTVQDTLALQDVLEIGDLQLLPVQAPTILQVAQARAEQTRRPIENCLWEAMAAETSYRYECFDGVEPAWLSSWPLIGQTYFRTERAQAEAETLFMELPYAGLSYVIKERGLTAEVQELFRLERLFSIKQLAWLQQPLFNRYHKSNAPLATHTRGVHSHDVRAIAAVIGRNLGLSEFKLNLLSTAALTHDWKTPAGGDSVKPLAPEALDEDANYPKYLAKLKLNRLAKYGITAEGLMRVIRHEGVEGKILDMADKMAYVGRDAKNCLHHIEAGAARGLSGFRELRDILENHPYVCGVWDSVELQQGEPVFTDIARLVLFLRTRILMFRNLYYGAMPRFGEFLISRLFAYALYKRGVLTPKRLISMTDFQLGELLDAEFGEGTVLDACSTELARCRSFKTVAEGQKFVRHLRARGHAFVLMDNFTRTIKTGAHFPVWSSHGPVRLQDAHPEIALELEEMTQRPLVHVYYLDGDPKLKPEILARLKAELL